MSCPTRNVTTLDVLNRVDGPWISPHGPHKYDKWMYYINGGETPYWESGSGGVDHWVLRVFQADGLTSQAQSVATLSWDEMPHSNIPDITNTYGFLDAQVRIGNKIYCLAGVPNSGQFIDAVPRKIYSYDLTSDTWVLENTLGVFQKPNFIDSGAGAYASSDILYNVAWYYSLPNSLYTPTCVDTSNRICTLYCDTKTFKTVNSPFSGNPRTFSLASVSLKRIVPGGAVTSDFQIIHPGTGEIGYFPMGIAPGLNNSLYIIYGGLQVFNSQYSIFISKINSADVVTPLLSSAMDLHNYIDGEGMNNPAEGTVRTPFNLFNENRWLEGINYNNFSMLVFGDTNHNPSVIMINNNTDTVSKTTLTGGPILPTGTVGHGTPNIGIQLVDGIPTIQYNKVQSNYYSQYLGSTWQPIQCYAEAGPGSVQFGENPTTINTVNNTNVLYPVRLLRGIFNFRAGVTSNNQSGSISTPLALILSDSFTLSDSLSFSFIEIPGGIPVENCPDIIASSAFCTDIKTGDDFSPSEVDCSEVIYTETSEPC